MDGWMDGWVYLTQCVFGGEGLATDLAREDELICSAVVQVGVAAGSDAAAVAAVAAVIVRMRCG